MKSNGLYDFLTIDISKDKRDREVYSPSFEINSNTKDLMIRGKKFYAIFNPKTNMWETDINVAMELIDEQVFNYVTNRVGKEIMDNPMYAPTVKRIVDTKNGLSKKFRNFCEVDMEDHFTPLNQVMKWSNSDVKKDDYISYKLSYPLVPCPTPFYNKIMNHLYMPEEVQKIEFLIGAMCAGDQGKIQKFFVFFGEPGSGKSTVIDKIIVDTVFDGKSSPFTAKFTAELLVNKDSFGTDFLITDPIFAYDNDADLSRVDSKTTLNMIVSHERVRVNSKYGRIYMTNPKCFLVCGTNEPVQLSPKSGFIRRLIDIRPTGETLPVDEYDECLEHLKFEKSGIAQHCLDVYKKLGKNYYNHYIPEDMLSQTSPFHNFVKDNYLGIKDGVTLANAYNLYTNYCTDSNLKTVMPKYKFRDQLKLYFESYGDYEEDSGKVTKCWFSEFKSEKIGIKREIPKQIEVKETNLEFNDDTTVSWLKFNCEESVFDKTCSDLPAQYAKEDGSPTDYWANVTTVLGDLDTSKLHYVKVPENHIVIDFDLKDEKGEKSYMKNFEAARKFQPTYAELSKSGTGIHLHYIYTGGDVSKLSSLYGDNIEVKIFKGNAALRRKLTYCNDLPIAEISTGLPLKEAGKRMLDWEGFKNEKILRTMICKNLEKEYHPATKPSIDYIYYLLDQAYKSGSSYDVRDLYQNVFNFASMSTHKSEYCVELVSHMHFVSDDILEAETYKEDIRPNFEDDKFNEKPIAIFDIETYPGDRKKNMEPLLLICYKLLGPDKDVVAMINPTPDEVKEFIASYRLIGFNNRDYDNHIIYARSIGMSLEECNRRSQLMINGKTDKEKQAQKFIEAYRLSYADIRDFAANKQGLKKWEIDLGISHIEMAIPWDKPCPKEMWPTVVKYCKNDVIATEAVFNKCQGDFTARKALAELSGLTVNDPNRKHILKLIVGDEKTPKLVYTDFATGIQTEGR